MATIKVIAANRIGRWHIIQHPATGEWVMTKEVAQDNAGGRSSLVTASQESEYIWVTLENGEKLRFAANQQVVCKE